jgi:hypothetical protein
MNIYNFHGQVDFSGDLSAIKSSPGKYSGWHLNAFGETAYSGWFENTDSKVSIAGKRDLDIYYPDRAQADLFTSFLPIRRRFKLECTSCSMVVRDGARLNLGSNAMLILAQEAVADTNVAISSEETKVTYTGAKNQSIIIGLPINSTIIEHLQISGLRGHVIYSSILGLGDHATWKTPPLAVEVDWGAGEIDFRVLEVKLEFNDQKCKYYRSKQYHKWRICKL